jgi:hypothetical protein
VVVARQVRPANDGLAIAVPVAGLSRPLRHPVIFVEIEVPNPVRISIRAAPAVIAWHIPRIEAGEPSAEVNVSTSTFSHPNALDEAGFPTASCRQWITKAVREAILRDTLKRWVTWPDLSVTSFPEPDLTPHHRAPQPTPSRKA